MAKIVVKNKPSGRVGSKNRNNSSGSAYDASIESIISVSKHSVLSPVKRVDLDNLVCTKVISKGQHSLVRKYEEKNTSNKYVIKELCFQE